MPRQTAAVENLSIALASQGDGEVDICRGLRWGAGLASEAFPAVALLGQSFVSRLAAEAGNGIFYTTKPMAMLALDSKHFIELRIEATQENER